MKPELLSPAGSYESAIAAFQYGADAIYLGLTQFSARAEAQNITREELALIQAYAQTFTPAKKIYITFNTLLYNNELTDAFKVLSLLEELNPDGVIVQDLGIIRLIRNHFPSLPLHASTQMAAHNLDSVLELKDLGFERVVLARELSLKEIKHIVDKSGVEIEIFIHGALCYSYSGLCLFSSMTTGRSGNRGRCAYCCRHPFTCNGKERHPFSMKDMALLPILDSVVDTGTHSLKIEGRMKSPLYVACVTNAYRRKLDGDLSAKEEQKATEDIQTIFSRPWTKLYTESIAQDPEELIDALTVGHRGAYIGKISSVRADEKKHKYISFKTSRSLEKFDGIQIDIPGMSRPYGFSLRNMRTPGEKRKCISIPAGVDIEIEISDRNAPEIRKGAAVYCSSSQEVQRHYRIDTIRPSELNTGIPIDIEATTSPDKIILSAHSTATEDEANYTMQTTLEAARNPERTPDAMRKACSRLGETNWSLNSFSLNDSSGLYVPPALMNQARRELIRKLDAARESRLSRKDHEYSLVRNKSIATRAEMPQPEFTLKTHLSESLPPSDELQRYTRIVIEIDHSKADKIIDSIKTLKNGLSEKQELLLATPLITRMRDAEPLCKNLELLIHTGFDKWECADLAGYRMLKTLDTRPISADWTLYAFNQEASAQLKMMGFKSHVTSPDLKLAEIYPTCEGCCDKEFLIYQHTPLYISTTPPLTDDNNRNDSQTVTANGKQMTINKRGQEWVTTSRTATDRENEIDEALKAGITRFRVDYSWNRIKEFRV